MKRFVREPHEEKPRASAPARRTARTESGLDNQTLQRRHNGAEPGLPEGSGAPLPEEVRAQFEGPLGVSLDGVRVHTGSEANASARARDAHAWSVGRHLVFADGAYAPHTASGQKLLAHELTHVAQRSGSSSSTAPDLPGHPAELEAAATADALAQGRVPPPVSARIHPDAVHRQPAGSQRGKGPKDDPKFLAWWKDVIHFEGNTESGIAPNDKGGETHFGVTRDVYFAQCEGILHRTPTEDNFKALSEDEAMLFGWSNWNSSGAFRLKNPGVALVLADWFWGGIGIQPGDVFYEYLKAKGRAPTFEHGGKPGSIGGRPDQATMDFINSLEPYDLVEELSDARNEYHRRIKEHDPSQRGFTGWETRVESRRKLARKYVKTPEQQVREAESSLDEAEQYAWDIAPNADTFEFNPDSLTDPGHTAPFTVTPAEPNPIEGTPEEQAEASADIFDREQQLLYAQARSLKQMEKEGKTDTPEYRERYEAFVKRRDAWAGQIAQGLEVLKNKDPDQFADSISRMEMLRDWHAGQLPWYNSVKAPPPQK